MTNEKPTVGWIGTGRMGFQLAKRLLRAGYDVAVYNRTKSKAEPLAAFGATIVDRPVDLADRDVVFIMVSTGKDLVQIVTGDGGLLSDPTKAPKVIADSSTVDIDTSEQIRAIADERGIGFLATPVSGNPKVIAAGKLTVAVSGPKHVYETVEPLLATWGNGSTYVGEGESARIVKIAHNVMLGVVIQNLVEITLLAESYGVKRADFLKFFNDSAMGSMFTRYKSPALVNLDFTPTFTPVLLLKDLDLGLHAAYETGVIMPVTSATRQIVASEVGDGNVDQDFASLIMTWAKHSGMAIESEGTQVDDGLAAEE